jgi:nuclear transport factor 2 (NTF2) superfamily protein
VRFAYEWHDDSGNWYRSFGSENWEFNEDGLMQWRLASINDLPSRSQNAGITGRLVVARMPTAGLSDLGL